MELEIPDRREMNKRQRKLFETSLFLGRLLTAGIIFQLILFLYPSTYGIQAWFAGLISTLLGFTGLETTKEGIFILLDGASYRVTQDCLGWKSMAVFTGLMFASSSLRKHYRFLLAGIAVLLLANTVRVVSTVYLSHTGIISFSIIHGTLWKWGLTAVVLGLWVYWFRSQSSEVF